MKTKAIHSKDHLQHAKPREADDLAVMVKTKKLRQAFDGLTFTGSGLLPDVVIERAHATLEHLIRLAQQTYGDSD